jgi:hypothetical protein
VVLDPETESEQGSQLVAHTSDIGPELAQGHVITARGPKPLEKPDVQAGPSGCCRRHLRLPIRFNRQILWFSSSLI